MMIETLDKERKVAAAEILCDMLLGTMGDLNDTSNSRESSGHEQNKREPFKAKGIYLRTAVFVSPGSAPSGEHETSVSSL